MPIIDFTLEAHDTLNTLAALDTLARTTSLNLNEVAVNFRQLADNGRVATTQISGLNAAGQRVTTTFREEAGALVILNQRLTENAAANRAATTAATNRARAADATTARGVVERTINRSGLRPDENNSIDARMLAITSAVARGRATLAEVQNAVAASLNVTLVGGLNEVERKVLNTLNRITATSNKATQRAQDTLGAARERGTNERFGQATMIRLNRMYGPDMERLDSAAAERVRNQIDKIRNLFSRGLTGDQYRNAFRAFQTGATSALTETEREVRHRLERIRIEMEKVPKQGFLNNLFGNGGSGAQGGLLGGVGGTNKVIGGLILAKGVQESTAQIKEALTEAGNYTKQIGLLQTLSQDTGHSFDEWSTSITKVSDAVGRSREEIAQAGYDLLSNQITKGVADTEDALDKTARFATATNSTVVDSVNLLSSIINSFGKNAGNTEEILSKLFTVIDLGRLKASDLANTMGRPAVAARSLGISFEELAAAQITISQTGLGAEQTNTLLTNVFHKMLSPTKELQEHYDKLGVATAENFFKTYGFIGALENLTDVTHGSASEINKFFNEIRGEQGFTQLALRLPVLKDALKKLGSSDTLEGAKKLMETTSGQKFQVEMTKIANFFTDYKKLALDWLVSVTDGFGGLSTIVETTSYMVGGLGIALATLFAFNKFSNLYGGIVSIGNAVTAVGWALEATIPFFAVFAAAASVGVFLGTLIAAESNIRNVANDAQVAAEELSRKQVALAVKANEMELAGNKDKLNKMQADALKYVATVRSALDNVAEAQKKTFDKIGDELKNSFELVAQALKKTIGDGEAREKAASDNVTKYRERSISARAKQADNQFALEMKQNELNVAVGMPDDQDAIYSSRIEALTNQGRSLAGSKNPKDAERAIAAIEKAQELAQSRAMETTRDDFGNEVFKYRDGWSVTNDLAKIHEGILKQIRSVNAGIASDQAEKNAQERKNLKTIQDKGAKVSGFDPFDATGKLKGHFKGNTDEARKELAQFIKEYQTAVEGKIPAGALLQHGETLENVKKRTEGQLKEFEKANSDRLNTQDDKKRAEKVNEETTKSFAERQKELEAQKVAADEASRLLINNQNSAKASLEALKVQGNRTPLEAVGNAFIHPMKTPDELMQRVPEEAQKELHIASLAMARQDLEASLEAVTRAQKIVKDMGEGETPFRGKDGKDVDEKGNPKTLDQFLGGLKAELITAQSAKEELAKVDEAGRKTIETTGTMVETLAKFASKYTDVSKAAEQFATISEGSFQAIRTQANGLLTDLQSMVTVMGDLAKKAEEIQAAKFVDGGKGGELFAPPFVGPPEAVGKYLGGQIHYRAFGGPVVGSDKNLVMAADREVIMNQRAADNFLPQLIAMNAGFDPGFGGKRGESGNSYQFGDMNIHVRNDNSPNQTARTMVGEIKRQIRRGAMNL